MPTELHEKAIFIYLRMKYLPRQELEKGKVVNKVYLFCIA